MGAFYKSRNLSIAEQDKRINTLFPNFSRKKINSQKKEWTGYIQPTTKSKCYKIKIEYKFNQQPRITVLEPELVLARGKNELPHVYSGNKLCLFSPENNEWTHRKFIADTIIPWTSLWLFYYEGWLYTGKWEGGGKHPNTKQKTKKKKKNERIKI